jgi:hypothetical protein
MILHAVLFRPKPTLTADDREAMFAALHDAARDIPAIRRFQIGSRVQHGAAYERMMTQHFPFAAFIEFDDLEALQEYLRHPGHQRLGELFYALQDAALAYDYDCAVISGS